MSDWALEIMRALGHVGLALVPVAENPFPPIPSEAVLPLAGRAAMLTGWRRVGRHDNAKSEGTPV